MAGRAEMPLCFEFHAGRLWLAAPKPPSALPLALGDHAAVSQEISGAVVSRSRAARQRAACDATRCRAARRLRLGAGGWRQGDNRCVTSSLDLRPRFRRRSRLRTKPGFRRAAPQTRWPRQPDQRGRGRRLSLSPWLAPLPLRLLGISPSLLRLRILLPPLLLPAVLPALLALLVVAASRSIRGSAGTPPVLDSVRKIGTRE